jgi:hypothetical protein
MRKCFEDRTTERLGIKGGGSVCERQQMKVQSATGSICCSQYCLGEQLRREASAYAAHGRQYCSEVGMEHTLHVGFATPVFGANPPTLLSGLRVVAVE